MSLSGIRMWFIALKGASDGLTGALRQILEGDHQAVGVHLHGVEAARDIAAAGDASR